MSETRAKIVDTAITLFAKNGYATTSVADIQTAVGLTAGSGALYKHFPSKQALLEAVAQHHIDSIGNYLATAKDSESPSSAMDRILQTAQSVWDGIHQSQDLMRILYRDLESGSSQALDRLWAMVNRRVFWQFADQIREGIATGEFIDVDPEQTAVVLVSSLAYVPTTWALIHRTPALYTSSDDFLETWARIARASLIASCHNQS